MTLKKKIIQGVKWTVLEQVGVQAIGFIIFIILARLLEAEDFGLIAITSACIAFVKPFINSGLSSALIQRDSLDDEHLDSVFWFNVTLGIAFTVMVFFCSGLIADFYSQPKLEQLIRWMSFGFILSSLITVQEAIIRRNFEFKKLTIRTLVATTAGGIVGIVMALSGFGVWSLVARQLMESITGIFLLWNINNWRPRLRFSLKHFLQLYRFGITMLGNEMLEFVNRRSANLLIGYFLGPVLLGYYSVAYRLVFMIFQIISKSVFAVGMPAFARIQADVLRVERTVYSMTRLTAVVAFPVFIGVSIVSPEFLVGVFGEKWIPSVKIVQVLSLIGIAHCLLGPIVAALVGVGKPEWRIRLQAIDAAMSMTGLLIALRWGINAVAISYVVVGYLLLPLWVLTLMKIVPLQWKKYLRIVLVPALSSLMMAVCVYYFMLYLDPFVSSLMNTFIGIFVGGFVYILTVSLLSQNTTSQVLTFVRLLIRQK